MRPSRLVVPLLVLGLVAPAEGGAKQQKKKDSRLGLQEALVFELDRSMGQLEMPGYERPYFISYTVREHDDVDIVARHGAIHVDERRRSRSGRVEVRVGSYKFDNTADTGLEGDWAPGAEELYEPGAALPLDDDADGLRAIFWLLTDSRYKEALALLHQKRGRRATAVVEDESLPSFAHATPQKHVAAAAPLALDRKAWSKALRAASARFKAYPAIFDSDVVLSARREIRWLVNTEGTRLITERTIFGLTATLVVRADDGSVFLHGRSWYGAAEAEIPSGKALTAAVDALAAEAEALRKAPVADPYTGPAILMEEATGVLFHEVIGHRLEGERLDDDAEGQTFKGQLGRAVIPDFLDVLDDPTQARWEKISLNGHYGFDDEGVAAEAVTLIEKGVLRAFLTSRRPVTGQARSNGHGRADGAFDPMARMAVTIVKSRKQVKLAKLKEMLIAEARRQGKPYGLIIVDVTGGNTNTATGGYQAFKGTPQLVYRVDAKTGAETLVRGVELVGTPLTSIGKIVATSDTMGVFNGYCGAESGYVPVSTVAPAVLMTEIELQRSQKVKQKATVLPAPWRK